MPTTLSAPPLKQRLAGIYFETERIAVMDTMTYASVAVLPWTIAENNRQPVLVEPEIVFVDLSFITQR